MIITTRKAIKSSVFISTVPTNDFITRITWVLNRKVAGQKKTVKSNRNEIWKMILLMIKLIGNQNMPIQKLLESFISIG